MGKESIETKWERIITAWARSGKTQREFCRIKSISFWSFRNWRAKLHAHERSQEGAPSTPFVEVARCASPVLPRTDGFIRIIHPSGIVAEMGLGIDAATTAMILKAIFES